jgi:hypothetical protein
MGKSKLRRRREDPSDELILAAVQRAQLHGPPARPGVPVSAVRAHLSLAPRSGPGRGLGARLDRLRDEGLLSATRLHGAPVWGLTPAGRRRLHAARRGVDAPLLPESPQHARWRQAQLAAGTELERFASELRAALEQAETMLGELGEGAGAPHSDRWLALGRRLQGNCRRLASAWHCLYEWPEPDDARADRDEEPAADGTAPSPALRALRAGRRNVTLWEETD